MRDERTITPNAPADFTPQMGDYKTLQPFRYWCQKVLPLVYDDSLSYYELLCKVVDYLNKTMEDVETLHNNVTSLHTAYEELQSYVNNYFSTLDVQEEINKKLDEMAKSGELLTLFTNYYPIVTPNMYGCVGNGETDDTENFMKAINAVKGKNILLMLSGTYKVSDLVIDDSINIEGNSGTIICNSIKIYKNITDNKHTIIKNTTFDSVNGVVISGGKNIIISGCTILTDTTGIELKREEFQCYECIVENTCIYAKTFGKIGIMINTSDCTINNINMRNFKTAYKGEWQCTVYNLHAWLSKYEYIPGSIFCDVTGGSPHFGELEISGSCIDTYQTAFKLTNNPPTLITNCRTVYSESIWTGDATPTIFNFEYEYPIEYLKLKMFANNFEGFYTKKGRFCNIYIKPLTSGNFINGWSDYPGYSAGDYFHLDTTNLPPDHTETWSQLWRDNVAYLSFEIKGTFEAKQTQLFWNNTYNNNKGMVTHSTAIASTENGEKHIISVFTDVSGVYANIPVAGKLTLNGSLYKIVPWEHTV